MRTALAVALVSSTLLSAGCLQKPEKDYRAADIPQITSLKEVMRVQADRADPYFAIRDQGQYSDEEFARMEKVGEIIEATAEHTAREFGGKGSYDDGFVKFAQELAAQAKALRAATEENSAAKAGEALEKMRNTCKACHGVYR